MTDRITDSKNKERTSINKFLDICKRKNYEIVKATKDQDRIEHWDYLIKNSKIPSYIDLKAKKDNRWDITYLEFVGITGHDGWLFGKAEFFLFEQPEGFLAVPSKELLNWALKKAGVKDLSEIRSYYKRFFTTEGKLIHTPKYIQGANLFSKNKELYKLYSREAWHNPQKKRVEERHDIMMQVKIKDIKKDIKNHFIFV
jgi:hypothetical protein